MVYLSSIPYRPKVAEGLRAKHGSVQKKQKAEWLVDLVWWPQNSDRSVRKAQKQAAILAAKVKLKRGNKSVITDSRRATDAEQKLLDKGIWVRSGPNGKASGFKGMRGQGPPVGGY